VDARKTLLMYSAAGVNFLPLINLQVALILRNVMT